MRSIRKFTLACFIAATAALPLAAHAQGSLPNQDTYFTFSAPVELPGATLAAGKYLFVLADTPGNRHVVRIMSADRKTTFATVMAIPSYSTAKPSDEPEIRFMEAPANSPHAVKLWIYPGQTVGHEFLYPRSQAIRLAKASGEPVLTAKTEQPTPDVVADADMTRVDPEGRDEAVSTETRPIEESLEAERGTRTADQSAQVQPGPTVAEPAPAPAPAMAADRKELPRTASPVPTITLIGVGALAMFFVVRGLRASFS